MSKASREARAERRAVQPADVLTPERDGVMVFGLRLVPGQGWVWFEARVPVSVLSQSEGRASVPEILPITLAKLTEAIQAHASRGVV